MYRDLQESHQTPEPQSHRWCSGGKYPGPSDVVTLSDTTSAVTKTSAARGVRYLQDGRAVMVLSWTVTVLSRLSQWSNRAYTERQCGQGWVIVLRASASVCSQTKDRQGLARPLC